MARLNVEEKIFADVRFQTLAIKMGSQDAALGLLMRFWWLAQKHWGQGKLIPEKEFRMGNFTILEDVALAEKRETGYYASGAEEHFAWYKRQVMAGKKRGGEALRGEGGEFLPVPTKTPSQTHDRVDANQVLTLTLTPTPILTLKEENTNTELIKSKPSKSKMQVTDRMRGLADRWSAFQLTNWPYSKPNIGKYSEELMKVQRRFKFSDEQMDALFAFIQEDDFWKDNCQSPMGLLRKSKNGLTKCENVLAKLRREQYSHASVSAFAEKVDSGEVRLPENSWELLK